MNQELTQKAKQIALSNGADLVGVVNVESLNEHSEDIHKILPAARSVVVVAAKHSLAAIQSQNTCKHRRRECGVKFAGAGPA